MDWIMNLILDLLILDLILDWTAESVYKLFRISRPSHHPAFDCFQLLSKVTQHFSLGNALEES